eukprot:TRINITY_DN833_c0_g1_i2.p1 TRINITY_DN833_c0_g1~~TRINITY_DN833_c0_g1_i2.p1  ORF type:complete len:106 (+),score=20.61 TRINITY_DN833_c0_g1_i2:104-421(+)
MDSSALDYTTTGLTSPMPDLPFPIPIETPIQMLVDTTHPDLQHARKLQFEKLKLEEYLGTDLYRCVYDGVNQVAVKRLSRDRYRKFKQEVLFLVGANGILCLDFV